jgi:tRNA 5-methylaminomethyl-2-thiouridine biosynthesis bifunctional protein
MNLQWLDETRPYAKDFDDIYYAEENGLSESRYVFIDQNNLEERFRKTESFFAIGELGFGTGLNFLATWDRWRKSKRPPSAILHYISCEKYPLTPDQIRRALSRWPELNSLAEEFLKQYVELPLGFYRFRFEQDGIILTLLIGDALTNLRQLHAKIDAWYFDGFSPQKNPALWSPEIFSQVAKLSLPSTTFATYAAAGFVKRNLTEAGFLVEKSVGFGRKREMLKGRFQDQEATKRTNFSRDRVTIIGAGIAGCSVAQALSRRGFQVQLIDEASQIASKGSGNLAGNSLLPLTAHSSVLSQLGLSGLVYLRNELKKLGLPSDRGLLQFFSDDLKFSQKRKGLESSGIPESFARVVSAEEVNEKAGIEISKPGIFFEHATNLSLPQLSQNLSDEIPVLLNQKITEIQHESHLWKIFGHEGFVTESEILILCSASEILKYPFASHLPLRTVRGQIAYIESQQLSNLKIPLCFDSYLSPRLDGGVHTLGATYDRENLGSEIRPHENEELIQNLNRFLDPLKINAKIHSARVGFRTNCPGQEPMVGALFSKEGERIENAYLLTALASRGSIYAGIAAEFLASQITGEPLPISEQVLAGINPRRFIKNGFNAPSDTEN